MARRGFSPPGGRLPEEREPREPREPRTVEPRENDGGDGTTDLPDEDWLPENPTTRDPSRRSNRRTGSAAQRERTVHAANGTVPVHLGGPEPEGLPSGGYIIFQRKTANPNRLYVNFAVGDGGEWGYEAISNIFFSDKTAIAIGATTEIHLGVPGDTTSTLISEVEPAYTIPEGIAHVAVKFSWPTIEYDPFAFKCSVKGILAPDVDTDVPGFTRNTPRLAHAMMLMAGMVPGVDFIDDDWSTAQAQAAEIRRLRWRQRLQRPRPPCSSRSSARSRTAFIGRASPGLRQASSRRYLPGAMRFNFWQEPPIGESIRRASSRAQEAPRPARSIARSAPSRGTAGAPSSSAARFPIT